MVEKDSLFQRLSEDRLYKTIPCVLVTASKDPSCNLCISLATSASTCYIFIQKEDIQTWLQGNFFLGCFLKNHLTSNQKKKKRVLLKRLQDELHLPILGLFDWNVGGLGVMLTYKYGSVAMGLEAYNYSEY